MKMKRKRIVMRVTRKRMKMKKKNNRKFFLKSVNIKGKNKLNLQF